MSKLRNKFIAVLAVLFCALLALSTALTIPKNEKVSKANTSGTLLPNDIVNTTTHLINDSGLKDLFTALTKNKATHNYSDVVDLFTDSDTVYDAAALSTLNGSVYYDVKFDGKAWIPTYLSKDDYGNIILTLWLAEAFGEAQWSVRTGSSVKSASGTYKQSYSGKYPSSMYSTSYIRAYINGTESDGQTPLKYSDADANLTSIDTNYNNYWVKFIRDYSNYIVTPNAVSWQGTESTTEITDPFSINGSTSQTNEYCRPNDAWGTPNNAKWKKDNVTNATVDTYLITRDYYTDWAADKLWLVSLAEAVDGGLWKLNNNQRGGSSNTGLRSGGPGNGATVYCFDESGACGYHSNGDSTTYSKETYNIRPAFHFNITKAMELSPSDITTTYTGSNLTIDSIYDSKPNEVSWYNTSIYTENLNYVNYEYKLNDSVSPVLNAYTYKATMTLTESAKSFGYKWANPDNLGGTSKTIKITVNKKKVKVTWNYQATVTSGVDSEYPKVEYAAGQLADNDLPQGDVYPDSYPKLIIRYESADSDTPSPANKYVKPTRPGKYKAYAEIDSGVEHINYEIITENNGNFVEFEVEAVKVIKPTFTNIGNLTYSGSWQEIVISNTDGLTGGDIQYTVKKGSNIVTDSEDKNLEDIKDTKFSIIDAGEYTVTFTFVSDKKETHVWKDSKTNADYVVKFKVAQKPLSLKLIGSESNPSSVKFDEGVWGAKIAVTFTVDLSDVIEGETVKLYVYFTDKDGGGITGLGGTDTFTIPDNLEKGDYILYVTLDSPSSHAANANYVIKFEDKTQLEKPFTVTIAYAEFKESNLVWQYTNELSGTNDIASGDSVKYNGKEFTVSLKTSFEELEKLGVKVDKSYGKDGFDGALKREYANGVNGAESVYTVTVKIIAFSDDFKFDANIYEFKWYIAKADYELSDITIKWGYTARGNTYEYTGGAQYEGGADVAEGAIEMVILEGLPTGLTATLQGNRYSAVGKYTVKITDLTNNNLNYNNIESVNDYDWATYAWEIIARTLSTARWDAGEYKDGKMTVAPSVVTSPYNPDLKYRYYRTPECDGEEIDFDHLIYEDGTTETYYAQVYIADEDSGNWILGKQCLIYEFEIGKAKTAVTISVTAGGTYDGTPKPATVALVGTYDGIDINALDITYYKVGNDEPLDGAPTDAGNYSVVISLKSGFTERFKIKDNEPYTFEIKTLVLAVPEYDGTLTYNGEEQDIAKLIGLSDGWGNYITISIKSKTNGVEHPTGYSVKYAADYTVTITIRNDVNHGTTNNVEWIDKDKMPKILNISVEKLILHALGWVDEEYNSYIVFEENIGRLFVVYTVTDIDGKVVDEDTVEHSQGESFIVKVDIAEEHLGNVEIVFGSIRNEFEFFTDGGTPPILIALPTIAELTFNGTNQAFVVDYGEFEEYIEIDTVLSDPLTQYNVGVYKAYFKIKSGKNAIWDTEAGGRGSTLVNFTMNALELEEPKVDENQKFTYTGKEQTAVINIDAAILAQFVDIVGDYSATNAGDYSFTISIKESFAGNVVWADEEGEEVKTVDWTIEKAKLSQKWTKDKIPELELPKEFDGLEVEYVFTDENGKEVSKDELENGKSYTVTAELKDSCKANFEFVDKDGKALENPTVTAGYKFEVVDELANKKQAAKDALQKDADKKNAEIEASDMTDEEKAKAKAEVEAELQKGLDNIDKAASESEINSSYTESKTIIDEVKIIRKSSSSFPWWIIAVVAGVLAVAVIVIVVLKRRKATAEGDNYYDDDYDYDDDGDDEYDYDEEFIDDGDDY